MTTPGATTDAPMAPCPDLQQIIIEVQQMSQQVQVIRAELTGNTTQGVISYRMITDHVKDTAPQIVKLTRISRE